ncbi:Murinoglobulin-1 [Cryptotermes secundus]|uniref:TEP1-F n=1 Tax=Cryptotermes secundus TaxID=105785 RepID=A0A2J7PJ98_9NEOP|nr:alpha-1-inhibitor 3 isoform X2 [Cryptotermes secundus]PNF16410.1 Murinoglobulin-1 [Cryptotermes secundus]
MKVACLCVFVLVLAVQATSASSNRGFVFLAPKRLLADSTESVCLSLHNVTGTAHVSVDVLHPDSDDKITSTQHKFKNGVGGCLALFVPPVQLSRARLHLKVRFDEHYDYNINSVKEVHIQHDPYIVLIQTDKPVYKPGQEVKFRILTLTHDLMPVAGTISRVWIESPSQVRLAQWLDVSTEQGLVQLSFQLSHEPPQGLWEIKVERNKSHTHVQKFEVREYVLPRFEVTIKAPEYILADAGYLNWNICAKYTYGQPVKGQLHIKAIPQTPTWRQRKTKPPEINVMTQLNRTDGCYTFSITGTELGLHDWDIAPNSIVVSAFVTERGTDNIQNVTSVTSVIHQALKLEFLPHSSQYFKPGLPYKGKVKVLKQDNTPAIGEVLQLCLKVRGKGEWSRTLVMCKNFTSDVEGFVQFLVPPQHHNVVLLSFVATAVGYQTKYYSPDKRWRVFMDQPSAFFDVHTWFSPTDSYIEITDKNEKTLKCESDHKFDIYYTAQPNVTQLTFHYLVKSRGDLIQFGEIQHHTQNQKLRLYEGFVNILGGNDDADRNSSEEAEDEGATVEKSVDKVALHIKILPKMSPLSYLLVYYVREDGETVASMYTIRVNKCFANKVVAKFSEHRQFPGSETLLEISASPHSLCAVSAVDKSISFLGKPGSKLDVDRMFQDLSRFAIDANSAPLQTDPWEYCAKKAQGREDVTSMAGTEEVSQKPSRGVVVEPPFWDLRRRRRKRFIATQPPSKYVDSIQAFDDFGVVVMSDLTVETRPCNTMTESSPIRGLMMPNTPPLAFPLVVKAATMLQGYMEDSRPSAVEVRSFFPETWLWELQYTGDSGVLTLNREVPHTITEWIGTTVCVSPQLGLGISPPAHLTAFQPFFLDYSMPYSVKRGEVVQLKVSLFNFLSYSLPVRIVFEDPHGVELINDNSTVLACVAERTTFVQQFHIRASDLGKVNITVSAEVDPSYPEECGPEILVHRRDVLVRPILVHPEGFPIEITKSAFICPSNFSEDENVLWSLELPPDVVEDSARADVSVVGDLLGPTLQNLGHLVRMPVGCGEQNMILFVPNLHVINYLNATQQENLVLKAEAIKNMEKGYQRELNYRHTDGSYSAFGDTDAEGSMWLTAFVVKSFSQARGYIYVDEDDLKVSMRWITKKQLENGCFPLVGKVFHKDMKGGLTGETSSAALTAYVLISLLETGLPLPPSVISNCMFCLKGAADPDIYTLVLTTYAFTLLGEREMAEESLERLLSMATRQQDLSWWEKSGTSSLGLSVEMTAYAVLSLVKLGGEENLINAFQAVRWISKHRNAEGGFVSTQDTVVALEALTKYAVMLPRSENGVSVVVTATEMEHTFHIHEHERLLLKRQHLPVLPTQVEMDAIGEGCALVQTSLRYNVRNASGSDAFDLEVRTGPVASVDECTMQRIEACVRYKLPDQTSNMAVLEVYMVTGYVPEQASLYQLLHQQDISVKRWEEAKDHVNLYFEELSTRRQCVGFLVVQETEVENPAPAIVRVYDYYQQELSVSTKYTTDGGCRNEKLPHPQPDIFNEDGVITKQESLSDELEAVDVLPQDFQEVTANINEVQVDVIQADSSTLNSMNGTEGLNAQFVDVDHEMETPSGEEGPVPSYALPQADVDPNVTGAAISCPTCDDSPPSNFTELYCNSGTVYKLSTRKDNNSRLLMNMSPGQPARRIRRVVKLVLGVDCRCKPLEKVGGHILLLDQNANMSYIEDEVDTESTPELKLNSSMILIGVETLPGQPEIVKVARNGC